MQPQAEAVRDYASALRAVADPAFLKTRKYQEQQWRPERTGAHYDILEFERRFVWKLKRLEVPVFAHCVVRTAAEQKRLFDEGRSKAAFAGPHMAGCAVDIIHSTKAWDLDRKTWAMFGHIGKEVAKGINVPIVWGGDWKFYDPAHWELKDWESLEGNRVA